MPMITRPVIDNTDWLKAAAIILVSIDHIGFFFIRDAHWWHAFGRLAAPVFFFLLGYARTRTVPIHWLWLGVALTLLSSWNDNWRLAAPNILLSFALIRLARPYVENLLERYSWVALVLVVATLVALVPFAGQAVDYGAEGWLWALFGLCQRRYVDRRSDAADPPSRTLETVETANAKRLLTCAVAAVVYVWQEQREFSFPEVQFAVFILGIGVLWMVLLRFFRGPSRIQPPQPVAEVLCVIGRRTLEIYAIQLAGFELAVKLVPSLTP
jgi:hypothetical protein